MAERPDEAEMHIPADGRMVLRTEGLVKKYGKRTVVNHVSINVKQGEIVGLLGPNGAGKTTSFYMTTGLIVPNEGHIYLNDLDITKYPVYKRAQNGIGYLAQEASVFRKMSVEDNIASVLEMTNKPKEYQREKASLQNSIFRRCARTWATSFQEVNVAVRRLPDAWPLTPNSLCSTSRLPVSTRLLWKIFSTSYGG